MKMLLLSALLLACSLAAVAPDAVPPLAVLHKGDTVLFQGDSITDGGRQRTGNDYNHTMGQDYAYILAARIGALYPERGLTFINRGISGNKVTDLAKRWQKETLDLKPQLLSILIGINDTTSGLPVEDFEKTYDQLLADTRATLPDTKIILCEPFILPVGRHKEKYPAERAELEKRQQTVARLAEKHKLPLVRYQRAFDDAAARSTPDYWTWDGIHPTYAGHGLMAEEWLRAVEQAWPQG